MSIAACTDPYDFPSGERLSTLEPPPGVNVRTATAQQAVTPGRQDG